MGLFPFDLHTSTYYNGVSVKPVAEYVGYKCRTSAVPIYV